MAFLYRIALELQVMTRGLGKPLFGSRHLKVGEMDGRAGAKKSETSRKRSAGAVDDQKWSKIARPKRTQFSLPQNERAG